MTKLEKWTEEHKALVRSMPTWREMPVEDFRVLYGKAQLSDLDPLLDQVLPVARQARTQEPDIDPKTGRPKTYRDRQGQERVSYKRATVYTFQTTEAGMLARAERMPDFLGVDAAAVFAEDEIEMDRGSGEVRHRFNPAKRKGALMGAWARVERRGRKPLLLWLDLAAVSQGGDFWAKMPMLMVEKCARVAVLRKTYPEAFGHTYIAEELPAEEREQEPSTPLGTVRKPELTTPKPAETPSSTMQEEASTASDDGVSPPGKVAGVCNAEHSEESPATEEEDELAREARLIIEEAGKLKTGDTAAYAALRKRTVALPMGSPERTTAGEALKKANARMKAKVEEQR